MNVTANWTDALVVKWLWCSPGMPETGVQSPIEALNFSVRQNPLLHLAPNYGIRWFICIVKAWRHAFPRGGWMWRLTEQMPRRSSGHDAHPECERLGFDQPLRHWIFQTVRTHCYIWHPIMGFGDLFVSSKHEEMLFPEGGECNSELDRCLGGLVVMMLTRNARDRGSIPPLRHWIFRSGGTHCYIKITLQPNSCIYQIFGFVE